MPKIIILGDTRTVGGYQIRTSLMDDYPDHYQAFVYGADDYCFAMCRGFKTADQAMKAGLEIVDWLKEERN